MRRSLRLQRQQAHKLPLELQLEIIRCVSEQKPIDYAELEKTLARLCLVSKAWASEAQRLLYQRIEPPRCDLVWDAILAHPHLGHLVETLDFGLFDAPWPLLALLPNLKHVTRLTVRYQYSPSWTTDDKRLVLSTLQVYLCCKSLAALWRNGPFDLRHLRRLEILFYRHDQPLDVEGDFPSDGLLLLEVVTLVTCDGWRCARRCTGSDDCPRDSSLHIWLDVVYRLVQSHRDRYPLLRSIDLGRDKHSISVVSFATRASRDKVRFGALAPKLRSVSLTIRDTTGLPWIEEWDAE